MTGTADTEAFEFKQIYGLDVVVVPTHRPMVRQDRNDLMYLSLAEKYDAIVEDIEGCIKKGQPVLVGTASIESSELLSAELNRRKVEHNVLNAKQHEREADIIADAGRAGSITIATNMAGRGTDIVLGGSLESELSKLDNASEGDKSQVQADWQVRHDKVLESGGLHIIGTERHESRRIDNQLRGRSGRQGDPGSTRFYLSLDDNLMRIFVTEGVRNMMLRLSSEEGEAIEHKMINRSIENAQRKVEGHNFDSRKNLLEYDDVSNDQRQVIYQQRRELMEAQDISATIEGLREEVVYDFIGQYIPRESLIEQWDVSGLEGALAAEFTSTQPIEKWLDEDDSLDEEKLCARILTQLETEYLQKEGEWTTADINMRLVEKQVMLQILDQKWKEHLASMDHLRQGIHLRAYAQKQPKQEFKRESFELFQNLLFDIKYELVRMLSRMQIESPEEVEAQERLRRLEAAKRMNFEHSNAQGMGAEDALVRSANQVDPKGETFVRNQPKVGRNEPCPCGSGRKYKQCHGTV
jgi:preprotein translocase subunit SecA